jgi:hypothetical protein
MAGLGSAMAVTGLEPVQVIEKRVGNSFNGDENAQRKSALLAEINFMVASEVVLYVSLGGSRLQHQFRLALSPSHAV